MLSLDILRASLVIFTLKIDVTARFEGASHKSMKHSPKAEDCALVKGARMTAKRITLLQSQGNKKSHRRRQRLKVSTELFLCNCNISLRVSHISGNMFHHTAVCLSGRGNVSANQSSSIRFNQHVLGQEGRPSPTFHLERLKSSAISYFQMDIGVYFTVIGVQ